MDLIIPNIHFINAKMLTISLISFITDHLAMPEPKFHRILHQMQQQSLPMASDHRQTVITQLLLHHQLYRRQ